MEMKKVNPKTDTRVKIRVVNFCEIEVSVDVKNKKAYAEDLSQLSRFHGWGIVGEDKKLYTNTDDITTNYLEVAMVKAMRHLGIEVKDIIPSPLDRKFEVVD